jgi:hypothetical protein
LGEGGPCRSQSGNVADGEAHDAVKSAEFALSIDTLESSMKALDGMYAKAPEKS